MPKVRAGMPKPPAGFENIAAGLDAFDDAMKDALAEQSDGKRKAEQMWGVSRVNSKRTRFVFDALRAGEIDKAVADYCVANGWIDGTLLKLWAIPGYESACCAQCVDSRHSTFGGACVCRVPAKDRVSGAGPCSRCGCTGCCSSDARAAAPTKAAATAAASAPSQHQNAESHAHA
jgi:bud site selection protein 31